MGPSPGDSSTDVLTDGLSDSMDSYWSFSGFNVSSISTVVIEITQWAGFNTFGVYDAANPMRMVQVFDGTATSASEALLHIAPNGSVFVNTLDSGIDFAGTTWGYYLDSTIGHPGWNGGVWYSDTSLNADGRDHMAAYQGKGNDTIWIPPLAPGIWDTDEYILAFEDLHQMHWGNQNDVNDGCPEWGDTQPDFVDFVVMVESVEPVETIPEPATLLLFVFGLIGVAGLNRKKFMG
jgi:hypothetical protein